MTRSRLFSMGFAALGFLLAGGCGGASSDASPFIPEPEAATLRSVAGVVLRTPDGNAQIDDETDVAGSNANAFAIFSKDVTEAASLGFRRVYITAPWDVRSSYRTVRLGYAKGNIDFVRSQGMTPVVNVGTWHPQPGPKYVLPEDQASLNDYVTSLLKESPGAAVCIGNEPNRDASNKSEFPLFIKNQTEVKSAVAAAGRSGLIFGFGGTTNGNSAISLDDYAATALSSGLFSRSSTDGIAIHIYNATYSTAAETPESLLLSPGTAATVISRAKAAGLPVYITESGAPDSYSDSTVTGRIFQASWNARALLCAMAAGVDRCFLFELRDRPAGKADPGFGLLTNAGAPKEAAAAVKSLLDEIGDYVFAGQNATDSASHFSLTFTKGASTRFVRWSTLKTDQANPVYPFVPKVFEE